MHRENNKIILSLRYCPQAITLKKKKKKKLKKIKSSKKT